MKFYNINNQARVNKHFCDKTCGASFVELTTSLIQIFTMKRCWFSLEKIVGKMWKPTMRCQLRRWRENETQTFAMHLTLICLELRTRKGNKKIFPLKWFSSLLPSSSVVSLQTLNIQLPNAINRRVCTFNFIISHPEKISEQIVEVHMCI